MAFGDMVPLFLIIVVVYSVITIFIIRKRNLDVRKVMITSFLVFSIIAILLITVFPRYIGFPGPRVLNIMPLIGMYDIMFHSVDIFVPIRNIGFNILLFVPFGFFLSSRKSLFHHVTMKVIVVQGILFSVSIEAVQYIIFPSGRSADIDDVILNVVGTYLGYLVFK